MAMDRMNENMDGRVQLLCFSIMLLLCCCLQQIVATLACNEMASRGGAGNKIAAGDDDDDGDCDEAHRCCGHWRWRIDDDDNP